MNTHDVFQFHLPTEVHFGPGKAKDLGSTVRSIGRNRAFLVTDKGVVQAGLLETVVTSLKKEEIEVFIFDEVEPDPSVETIDKGAQIFLEQNCDVIIAIGGGSPIDGAKGIRVVAGNGGSIRDYAGVNKVNKKSEIPLVAIPTTSGTGSEVTIFGVYSDWQNKIKVTVTSPCVAPTLAVVDPELTLTCPPKITAATGIDALAHAVETYVSRLSQPPSGALAEAAISLVGKYLRPAVSNGDDRESRIKMSQASLLAGMAFNQSYLGLAHAIGSALSGHAHVSHGNAIALLLPAVMKHNLPASFVKYRQIAKCLGEKVDHLSDREAAQHAVHAVSHLREDVGLPTRLRDVAVSEEQLPDIAKDSFKSGMLRFNPRSISEEQLLGLLKEIY